MFCNHLRRVLLMAGVFVLPSLPTQATDITDFTELQLGSNYEGEEGAVLKSDVTIPQAESIYVSYAGTGGLSSAEGEVFSIDGNNTQSSWQMIKPTTGEDMSIAVRNVVFKNFEHQSKGVLNISGITAELDNVTFNNVFSGSDNGNFWGGVLNIEGGSSVAIKNSLFTGTQIENSNGTGDGASGGVINVQGHFNSVQQSQISSIENTDFISNSVNVSGGGANAYGGVIANEGIIGTISGSKFEDNSISVSNDLRGQGGAIANGSANDDNRGNSLITAIENTEFLNNRVVSENGEATGGAIWNEAGNTIESINEATFSYNSVSHGTSGLSYGGAIYNGGTIGTITNSTFENNSAGTLGGAIYSTQDLTLSADNGNTTFSGNTDGNGDNDVYMAGADENAPVTLNLNTNNGLISFSGGINGTNYNISLTGTDTGGQNDKEGVYVNGTVDGVGTMTLNGGSKLWLGKDGIMNVQDMIAPSGSVAFLKVDVEVDSTLNTVTSGIINVANDMSGSYKVIVNPLNNERLENNEDSLVAFLSAPNDDADTATSVEVARVIGSTNMWKALLNAGGEDSGSIWYLSQTDETPDPSPDPDPDPDPDPQPTPDPDPSLPVVTEKTPEVIAAMALPSAAIEQTRDLLRTVSGKIAAARSYCRGCGVYPDAWNNQKLKNGWVTVGARTANIDKPFDTEADIWSVEAGFDLQNDINNSLGVFASYRQGEYDISGKGSKYFSTIGSELDIDSYLGGLYYRYDKNAWWLFASVYGGIQKADASTDDHLTSFDTDGTEFGGGIEGGKVFDMGSWSLTPSVGIFYTEIDFDSANDDLAKRYSWDKIRHLEAEAGVKAEKIFNMDEGLAGVYVEPSIVQTLTNDSETKVTGILDASKADGYHDQTLGRLEIGGKYFWDNGLSAFGWANYTFGSSYDATAFGLGINYAF